MANKKSLDSLPAEIFEYVAEELGPKDLKATRLVCRDSAAKVLRTYAAKLFCDLAFFINCEESLHTALDIAEHPVLGKAVRQLTFMVEELDEREGSLPHRLRMQARSFNIFTDKANSKQKKLASNHNLGLQQLGDGEYAKWSNAVAAQKAFRGDWKDLALLRKTFDRLAKNNPQQILRINIADLLWNTAMPTGCSEFRKLPTITVPDRTSTRAFNTILTALSDSRLQVKSLVVQSRGWYLPVHRIGRLKCHEVLSKFEELDLYIWMPDEDDDKVTSSDFFELLGDSLRSLHLETKNELRDGTRLRDEFIVKELLKRDLPALEELSLVEHKMLLRDIQRFVQDHPTLKCLRIEDSYFYDLLGDKGIDEDIGDCLRRMLHPRVALPGIDPEDDEEGSDGKERSEDA